MPHAAPAAPPFGPPSSTPTPPPGPGLFPDAPPFGPGPGPGPGGQGPVPHHGPNFGPGPGPAPGAPAGGFAGQAYQPQPRPQYDYDSDLADPYGDEEKPRRNRMPLLVAAGVVLALLIGVGVVFAVRNSSGSPSSDQAKPATPAAPQQSAPAAGAGGGASDPAAAPSASASASAAGSSGAAGPNAAPQAKALDDLLTRGENAKAPIGSAVAKVRSCPAKAEIDSAAEVFDTGAKQRDQLISDLASLQVGDVPGGADAVAMLRTAWQQSGDIDRAYAAWARTVSSQGCSGSTAPTTPDLTRANDLNPKATQSKKDFVEKWKPIAGAYNLAPRTWDRI
ncbi:hypothetical protein [Kitasatospora paracochleata]|uniref:Uncharacterized protein n=1 Tax=Kitasatospora paracochleata TaxID=58354 RepID=A0ABT1J1M8_9ACTN|nr:hypothetical protein [Kitasatospora paracochleata]MCP2310631.1 hypothetical protein [Kitasatospora paracochleata]